MMSLIRSCISRKRAARRGFTLIELLVVVAVIGILTGLILTAVLSAKDKAKRMRAKHDIDQLYQAWTSYLQDYKKAPLPLASSGTFVMNSNAMAILRAGETTYNYNAIRYMDFSASTRYFCDPWGIKNSPTGVYQVLMDYNNQNMITYVGPSGATDIFVSVGVFSTGPDRTAGTADDVCSWRR